MSSTHDVIPAAKPAQIREMNMVSTASSRAFIGLIAAALLVGFAAPLHAKEFLKGERPQTRGYSQAVITEGGRIVWLAGQVGAAIARAGWVEPGFPCRTTLQPSGTCTLMPISGLK